MQPTPSAPAFAAFGPRNYRLMGLGLAVLAAGFLTMTLDTAEYGEGFLGITLGPILLIIGFVIEFFAIMRRDPAVVALVPDAAAGSTPVVIGLTDAPASIMPGTSPTSTPGTTPVRPMYKPL